MEDEPNRHESHAESQSADYFQEKRVMQPLTHEPIMTAMPTPTNADGIDASVTNEPTWFQTHFIGCMEMFADAKTAAEYFDAHQGWFIRCAHPMKAKPIGTNGYALTIGKFGSFGYQVEPKIGLHLLPQDSGVYRIETIPVPNYTPPGYEVEFKAVQTLLEIPFEPSAELAADGSTFPSLMTRVEWQLDLKVGVCFPQFIKKLPEAVIQKTGDRILAQIVKLVSNRLTYKVQEDFHTSQGEATLKLFKTHWQQTKGRGVCEQVSPPL